MSNGATDSAAGENFNTEILEEKLNMIIDQQKQRQPVTGNSLGEPQPSGEGATPEEVDRLKAEIYNLRQQIAESEKSASNMKPKNTNVSPTPSASQATNVNLETVQESAKKMQLEAKIGDLQSRLSEYEIIADDIAELSQLRTENAKLIQELAQLKASGTTELQQPKAESTEAIATTTASSEGFVAEPVQPSIEEMMGVDASISAQDQNSINDFEKNILKKENE